MSIPSCARRSALVFLALTLAPALPAQQASPVPIHTLGARVTAMKFFERDSGVTTFPYGTVFDQTQARFIGVMLEFEMPAAPREVMATYTCERVAPSGTKWQPEVARVRVQSGWTRVTWTTGGRGWKTPGQWRAGTYRVECRSGSQLIAAGSYDVRTPAEIAGTNTGGTTGAATTGGATTGGATTGRATTGGATTGGASSGGARTTATAGGGSTGAGGDCSASSSHWLFIQSDKTLQYCITLERAEPNGMHWIRVHFRMDPGNTLSCYAASCQGHSYTASWRPEQERERMRIHVRVPKGYSGIFTYPEALPLKLGYDDGKSKNYWSAAMQAPVWVWTASPQQENRIGFLDGCVDDLHAGDNITRCRDFDRARAVTAR